MSTNDNVLVQISELCDAVPTANRILVNALFNQRKKLDIPVDASLLVQAKFDAAIMALDELLENRKIALEKEQEDAARKDQERVAAEKQRSDAERARAAEQERVAAEKQQAAINAEKQLAAIKAEKEEKEEQDLIQILKKGENLAFVAQDPATKKRVLRILGKDGNLVDVDAYICRWMIGTICTYYVSKRTGDIKVGELVDFYKSTNIFFHEDELEKESYAILIFFFGYDSQRYFAENRVGGVVNGYTFSVCEDDYADNYAVHYCKVDNKFAQKYQTGVLVNITGKMRRADGDPVCNNIVDAKELIAKWVQNSEKAEQAKQSAEDIRNFSSHQNLAALLQEKGVTVGNIGKELLSKAREGNKIAVGVASEAFSKAKKANFKGEAVLESLYQALLNLNGTEVEREIAQIVNDYNSATAADKTRIRQRNPALWDLSAGDCTLQEISNRLREYFSEEKNTQTLVSRFLACESRKDSTAFLQNLKNEEILRLAEKADNHLLVLQKLKELDETSSAAASDKSRVEDQSQHAAAPSVSMPVSRTDVGDILFD